MEKAEISRLINSFDAIKAYFNTTKLYMPQIAKLVYFIEEIVPLLNMIHDGLNQSANMIPTATEKLNKVTSATELASTKVMDIVDIVINKLNTMSTSADEIDKILDKGPDVKSIKEKTTVIHSEIGSCQDDLFLIMNAFQFQDITTQQINSIASIIGTVHKKLAALLKGFDDGVIELSAGRIAAFDPNAEFNFSRSAKAQLVADDYIKMEKQGIDIEKKAAELESSHSQKIDKNEEKISSVVFGDDTILGEDGQPDINSIMNQLNSKDAKSKE
ncbi:MAG TPA: hypothetical protein ENH82_09465 [bacterium]|nr:hypothetical protein [bacterium]